MIQRTTRTADEPNLGIVLLWGVRLGILLILVTPLVVSQGVFFPYVVGKAVYARSMIEITFAIWVPLVLFYREYRPPRSWVILAFAVWVPLPRPVTSPLSVTSQSLSGCRQILPAEPFDPHAST